uniref:Integrase catalytic domain-containing protein n=1 Tax=Lactuca sativa TaxID=4236 RepID=A0A9R1XJQ5_LACSA|nr:hypothetical protein LSAT_V11C300142910 [Lactuca sativa]
MEAAAFKAFVPKRENLSSNQQKAKTHSMTPKREEEAQHCTFCDRDGHNRDGCFKLVGYPEWWPGKTKSDKGKPKASCVEGGSSPVPGLTVDQYNAFLKHFEDGVTTGDEGIKRVANMTGNDYDEDDWVVDTGATKHTTYRADILVNKRKSFYEPPVIIPNGDAIPVEGRGDCTLPGGIKIKGILHVPKFKCNLLSVSRLTKKLQCVIIFFPDFCVMQDLCTRTLIGASECKRGLYRIRLSEKGRKVMSVTIGRWHKRLGHTSQEKLAKVDFLKGVSFNIRDTFCDSCSKAKHTRSPFLLSDIKTKGCFELLHCDVWGKYRFPSFSGANYFLTVVDDFSRTVWVFLIKHKSDASTCLVNFCKMIENQFSKTVKRIRCDNGGEFTSNLMIDFYAKQGILLETTCPHTPQQNGVIERKHRHLLDTARALRFEANLPKMFWGECVLTAAYIINRLPSKTLDHKTPYELLYNQKPEYDHIMVFGCLTYFWSIETKGDKFEVRGRPGVFLGYRHGKKGSKIFDIENKKIVVSRDVKFHEDNFPFSGSPQTQIDQDIFSPIPNQSVESPYHEAHDTLHKTTNSEANSSPQDFDNNNGNEPQENNNENGETTNIILAAITTNDEPKHFKQAIQDPKWIEAMKKEIQALEQNDTWTLETLPKGKRAIDKKWVYKIKYKPNGDVERYKARLVAKGFAQIEGENFHDTFAPVAKLVTVRTLLVVATKNNWLIHQLDVNNAFLHDDLHEEVYMKIPQGFSKENETRVCRLRKSLYGLKQASRNWYQKFTTALLGLGFCSSKSDHSLFIYRKDGIFIASLIYVDNVIIMGNDSKKIQEIKQSLHDQFSIKDLSELKYFIGIEVAKTLSGLVLSQRKYTLDILEDCGMEGCRPSSFPIEQNIKLAMDDKDPKVDTTHYRRLIGRLLYLQATRPDIAYSVNILSQFVSDPRKNHMDALFRILRYLKATPGQGILLPKEGGVNLVAYSDSDWLGCPLTPHSRTGYLLLLGGAPISWKRSSPLFHAFPLRPNIGPWLPPLANLFGCDGS